MSNDQKYNGWKNRETWAVHLYITNDEGSYNELRGADADQIESYFDDLIDLVTNKRARTATVQMILDIGSIWRVDWIEVAKALTD